MAKRITVTMPKGYKSKAAFIRVLKGNAEIARNIAANPKTNPQRRAVMEACAERDTAIVAAYRARRLTIVQEG